MSEQPQIKMGEIPRGWGEGKAKNITFCVTEDCNLACKYCYMTGKNKKNKMSFEVAKNSVDYVLGNRDYFKEEAVIWDFIGGEPFLEIDLVDKLTDYIKQQMYLLDHPWFNAYRLSFSTNGLLYGTPKVQNYIKKNRNHLSIGISIDGNKIKHDMQRIKPDGSGSYDDVAKNIPLYIEQMKTDVTKATFAHEDLPLLKDSIIHLWNIGITSVAANVVFEDVWHEGDDAVFEDQLVQLADYIIENKLWNDCSVRFFDPSTGFPNEESSLKRNFCGTGDMLCIDYKGDLYPCVRFVDYSLDNRDGYLIGDIYNGIDEDKLRPFETLSLVNQSPLECIECEVASGCAWCSGCNYDTADTDTIYQRATYLCKMHKANVRAIEYFWKRYSEVTGLESPRERIRKSKEAESSGAEDQYFIQFITSDKIKPHCSYSNNPASDTVMSDELIQKGLNFVNKNDHIPVFLGNPAHIKFENKHNYLFITGNENSEQGENIFKVYDHIGTGDIKKQSNSIYLLAKDNLNQLAHDIQKLGDYTDRINIIIKDIDKWNKEDISIYEKELDKISLLLIEKYKKHNPIEINVLTDILNTKSQEPCDAGQTTFSLGPNGKFYICPAFYFNNPEDSIGDIDNGIILKNKQLLDTKNAPLCSCCDAYHCKGCKFFNKKMTREINTPSKIQCLISHVERNKAMELQQKLIKSEKIKFNNIINKIDYMDPLVKYKELNKW